MRLDVILPAGGRVDDAFAAQVGTPYKAIIPVGGRTVIASTMDALRGLSQIGRIALIGPPEVREHADVRAADLLIEEGATGPENIFRGLSALTASSEPEKILIVTTDLPFLTTEILARYIELCPPDKDFTVPLIGHHAWHERFPGLGATFVRLKDGLWTTGCAYVATVDGLRRARPHIERVFENRKSKIGMARLLGPGFLLKYLTKSLTVADIEKKVRQILDCSGVAVPNSPPELAFDIDYIDDYEYAQRLTGL